MHPGGTVGETNLLWLVIILGLESSCEAGTYNQLLGPNGSLELSP